MTINCNELLANFCTVDKCAELEAKIEVLEQDLALLKAAFDTHVTQAIPEAHSFDLDLSDYIKKSDLDVQVDVFEQENGNAVIKVQVIDESDEDTLIIEQDNLSVSVDVFEQEDGNAVIKVQVNDESDEDTLLLSQLTENNDDVLNTGITHDINFKVAGNFLTINSEISVNGESDSASDTVGLDFDLELALFGSSLQLSGNFMSLPIFDSVELGNLIQTVFITEQNEMECDLSSLENLLNNLDNKINQIDGIVTSIDNSVNNVSNTLNNVDNDVNNINNKVDIIDDAVTVDISGTINSNFSCTFPVDNDTNEPIPAYAEAESEAINYSSTGIAGLHETLKILANNIEAIYTESCRAIDPSLSILPEDLYEFCGQSVVKRSDYPDTEEGQIQYNDALALYLQSLLADSKYGYLLNNANSSSLITAPSNWINPIISDFSLIQSRINKTQICQIQETEPIDVVSIVASPKYITNVEGKVLILHFVTLDNYPKRSKNSSYRPIQIPAAKASYDWDIDFENLRWYQGNQYAELQLVDYKAAVSGWFENEQRANEYFNAILTLTNATEKNRVIPKHSNPQTNIVVRETRPYRAFIKSINAAGQAVCHATYRPIINNNE